MYDKWRTFMYKLIACDFEETLTKGRSGLHNESHPR